MKIDDLNIRELKPLVPPEELKKRFDLPEGSAEAINGERMTIRNILRKKDGRLIAVVGPCSIHDEEAALEYARRLNRLSGKIEKSIYIVMRVYFEKPRTTNGWKGLITDPYMNGTDNIVAGLEKARKLLIEIHSLGLPIGSEMLDPIVPQYIADLVSWAAIGARTTESQTHREMASGLSMPVGFKNGTDGSLEVAVNGMQSALSPHSFIGIDQDGRTCVVQTRGNAFTHIILRGGTNGPNYFEEWVEEAEEIMSSRKLDPVIMIDCSHGNSGKKCSRQRRVLTSLLSQKEYGNSSIIGFMLESNLKEGSQKLVLPAANLQYGVSVTDECIGWEETEELLLSAHRHLMRIKKKGGRG